MISFDVWARADPFDLLHQVFLWSTMWQSHHWWPQVYTHFIKMGHWFNHCCVSLTDLFFSCRCVVGLFDLFRELLWVWVQKGFKEPVGLFRFLSHCFQQVTNKQCMRGFYAWKEIHWWKKKKQYLLLQGDSAPTVVRLNNNSLWTSLWSGTGGQTCNDDGDF